MTEPSRVQPRAEPETRPADGDVPPSRGGTAGRRTGVLLVMATALALFFAPALVTKGQFLFRDSGRMHWPVKQYVAEQLRQGRLPQWNPYAGLGVPLVSGAIDAVQHPFNLLLVALPFELAFKLWALLSYALAASGAYAWARSLKRTRPAAVAAGLGFALSGSLVGASDNLTYLTTLAAIPWLFAAVQRFLERPRVGSLVAVGLASALCASGGDPQAWGFAVLLVPTYAVAVGATGLGFLRALLRGGAAAGAALAGAAPFILPVIAWMPYSSRGAGLDAADLQRWNLPLPRLLELGLPHMYRDAPGAIRSSVYVAFGGGEATPIPWVTSVYMGASVLAVAIWAAARSRPACFLLLGSAAFTWLAMGPGGGLGWIIAHAPVLSGFRYWEKMAIWPSLFLPLAAAHGLDEIAAGRAGRRAGGILVAVGLAAVLVQGGLRAFPGPLMRALEHPGVAAGVVSAFADNLFDGLLEAGLVTLLLGVAWLAIGRGLLRLSAAPLLALVIVGDVFAANVRGYLLADPAIVQQPAPLADHLRAQPGLQRVATPFELTRDRFPELQEFEAGWLWGGRTLASCFNLQHQIGNFEAYTGMVPARHDRFRRALPDSAQVPRLGLFGVGFLVVPGKPEIARAAGLRPPFDVAATDLAMPAFLVRFPHRPRAYLASELAPVDERGAMEFALSADPASPRSVVEGPLPRGYRPPSGAAAIEVDEPERVSVRTVGDGPALLVLNDMGAAGWSATVDGRGAAILATNYLVRGVWVGRGTHEVEFRYRTPLLREGWAVFLAGLVAATAAVIAGARRRRRMR